MLIASEPFNRFIVPLQWCRDFFQSIKSVINKEKKIIFLQMPRNIEVKARIEGNIDDLIERIQPFADGPPRSFTQNDTFFNCLSNGRLKLRQQQVEIEFYQLIKKQLSFFKDSPAELIYYERSDVSSLSIPKLSNYSIASVSHPNELKVS
jgi:hypothetical protein